MAPMPEPAKDEAPKPEPARTTPYGRHALGFLLGVGLTVLVFALVGLLIKGPAEALGRAIAERFGLPGVFLGVTVAETSPFPLMGEPILLLGIEGGLPTAWVLVVGCAANLVASALSYVAGHLLARTGLIDRLLRGQRAEAEELVRRQGAWALVIASFTPLPFATLAWTAGALRMPLAPYALASLSRIPKVLATLAFVWLGWALGK